MVRPAGRSVLGSVALLAAAVALSGCSARLSGADAETFRPSPSSRPAAADACVLSPSPRRVLGLPMIDNKTVRIAPTVVGEKVTWRGGRHLVTAWVGIDALDVFEDLDFVTVRVASGPLREWTTRVQPDLFVVEAPTGHDAPCNVLYVSTVGLPSGAARRIAADLHTALTPAQDVAQR